MGVSVEQWRAVIGSWCGARGPVSRRSDETGAEWFQPPTLILLAALLMIAGVEWNPGPREQDAELRQKIAAMERKLEEQENEKVLFEMRFAESTAENMKLYDAIIKKVKEMSQKEMQIEQQRQEKLRLEHRVEMQEKETLTVKNQLEKQRLELIEYEQRIVQMKRGHPAAPVNESLATTRDSVGVKKYKRTTGRATMEGQNFEINMIALIFIRAINSGQPFYLATNMAAAGSFDDIVIRTKSPVTAKWTTTLIQLKHKDSGKVGYAPLLSLSGKSEFGLVKYCDAFTKLKDEYCSPESDWPWEGEFDDFQFVLYTNSQSDGEVSEHEKESKVSMNQLFTSNTKGSAFKFSATSPIFHYLKGIIEFKKHLETLSDQIVVSSPDKFADSMQQFMSAIAVEKMSKELSSKKQTLIDKPTKENVLLVKNSLSFIREEVHYESFLEKLYLYTGQSNVAQLDDLISAEIRQACHVIDDEDVLSLRKSLIESVSKWWGEKKSCGSWLTECSHVWRSIVTRRIGQLSAPKVIELRKEVVKYGDMSKQELYRRIENFRKINIVARKGSTSLVVSQVYQTLAMNKAVNFIFTGTKELLKRKDEMIAIWQHNYCQGLVIECDFQLSYDETNDLTTQLMEVIISQNLKVVVISTKRDSLAQALQPVLTTSQASCQWRDLTSESQIELLKRLINFQGHRLPLSSVIGDDDSHINQQFQGSGLEKFLNTELKVGQDLECLIKYYLPRKLTCDGTEVCISSLADVPDRVVLLIAEPGMGKTTLVSYLAEVAKYSDPATWVVRVKLNDASDYLAKLIPERITTATAIDFLTQFARNTDSCVDTTIFKNRLLFSGKIIAFVDSVDEVCPFYEKTVCSLLKLLLCTKIDKLWVTSRHVAKASLESTLNVRSFSLVAFSTENQKHFFEKFWEEKFNNTKASLTFFVSKVLDLSREGIECGNLASAIPQQTRMLAEYFDRHVDTYLETGQLKLPERINILKLFESFVDKKLNVYFEEKRKDEATNAAIKIDETALKRLIMKNHMHAGMMVLLSTEEFSELTIHTDIQMQETHSLEKTGIIDRIIDGKPYFLHRTFAEFFTALWISEHFRTTQHFLRNTLLDPRFHIVRTFLDLKLSNDCALHKAVINRDLTLVNSLLSSGNLANQLDSAGRTSLHLSAAYSGPDNDQVFLKITRVLLEHNADIGIEDKLLQWRPLRYADRAGSWTSASLILQAGGQPNDMQEAKRKVKPDVFDEFINFLSTPSRSPVELMLLSSRHGDLAVIKYLVEERGVDVSCRGLAGTSPMHKSAEGGHVEVMRFLRKKGASCDVRDDNDSRPLHYAASVQAAEFLLVNGSMLDESNKDGEQPLAWALRSENVDVAKFLIGRGADIDKVNLQEGTPYWSDFKSGNLHLEDFFVRLEEVRIARDNLEESRRREKANLDRGFEKEEPCPEEPQINTYRLFKATKEGCLKDLKVLVERGLPLAARTKEGDSLLHLATRNGTRDVIQYLIDFAPNLILTESDRKSVLVDASQHGSVDVVMYLHNLGDDLTAKDARGWTPLHIAARHGRLDVIRYLVLNRVDVGTKDNDGWSPLHFASAFSTLETVKLLHELGADPKVINKAGRKPVHVACKWGGNADLIPAFRDYLTPFS